MGDQRNSGRHTAALDAARIAALEVLKHNFNLETSPLPRTAGFGYPEPYTRDLMIAVLGVVSTEDPVLLDSVGRVLEALAENQSSRGHIPSLADEPDDRGESDTTPLFLIGLAVYRRITGEHDFLEDAAKAAMDWLGYQSPGDRVIVAQQPTSDWRDEQWVLGYGLYVNTLVYGALSLLNRKKRARFLRQELNRPVIERGHMEKREHEGLALPNRPYYALWAYKVLFSDRFDLLGNCLAILTGIASRQKAVAIVEWVERQCDVLQGRGQLKGVLPPVLFPYIAKGDSDWYGRYEKYNLPGTYHNGGIWPFVVGFYIAALVAVGNTALAAEKLAALTEMVGLSSRDGLAFGFNEWICALDGTPRGVDWQTWSAAMYLYAASCVEKGTTPIFDEMRKGIW